LPLAILFFFLGTLFAYWVVLPRAFDFFFGFGSDLAALMPRISTYLGFVTTLSLWTGLVFETPLIMGILSWLDIVRAATFGRYRRFAVVGAFVAGAFITPTGDPVNLMLVSIPIVVLYEIGALVARFVGRRPIVADLD
jgi:sec-independent protein translocase protein TatC